MSSRSPGPYPARTGREFTRETPPHPREVTWRHPVCLVAVPQGAGGRLPGVRLRRPPPVERATRERRRARGALSLCVPGVRGRHGWPTARRPRDAGGSARVPWHTVGVMVQAFGPSAHRSLRKSGPQRSAPSRPSRAIQRVRPSTSKLTGVSDAALRKTAGDRGSPTGPPFGVGVGVAGAAVVLVTIRRSGSGHGCPPSRPTRHRDCRADTMPPADRRHGRLAVCPGPVRAAGPSVAEEIRRARRATSSRYSVSNRSSSSSQKTSSGSPASRDAC